MSGWLELNEEGGREGACLCCGWRRYQVMNGDQVRLTVLTRRNSDQTDQIYKIHHCLSQQLDEINCSQSHLF